MKRAGRLFPALISDANLSAAIDEVNRTHRWGRHHRPNRTAAWVERTKPERVRELREIITRGYVPTTARRRTIYDQSSNKYREIYEPMLWPDQYIHHALVQVIQGPIMRGMDRWCCGSVPGRGTICGARAIRKWMNNDRKGTKYCAELDIRHFYQNLRPEVVLAQMGRIIKDKWVLDLIGRVLSDGVAIGSYCSQWFANAALQPLDHMIREKLGVAHYVRYMDNFTMFASSKKKLHQAVRAIDKWLRCHGMQAKGDWQVFPTKARMPNAMGYRYGRGFVLPRKKTVLRFKRVCRRAMRRIAQGRELTFRQACSIWSRAGWLKHCNGRTLLERWMYPIGGKRLKDIIRREARKWQAIFCRRICRCPIWTSTKPRTRS